MSCHMTTFISVITVLILGSFTSTKSDIVLSKDSLVATGIDQNTQNQTEQVTLINCWQLQVNSVN